MVRGRNVIVVWVLLIVGAFAAGTLEAASADLGQTPIRAALARTNRFANREASLHSTTYTLGTCLLLHKKPWLGYRCSYTIHRLGDQCHDSLTVAVRRTANREYDATAVKWYGSGQGAPC